MKTYGIAFTALCLLPATACGPSHRRTYQSDNAFERCFDQDYNPAASIPEKQSCWTTWLGEYVYNQPPDKIEYAELRLDELQEEISIPGPPGPPGAMHQRPEPTESQPEPGPVATKGIAQTDECESGCKRSRATCEQSCRTDAGISDRCASACVAGYRACMNRCFAD